MGGKGDGGFGSSAHPCQSFGEDREEEDGLCGKEEGVGTEVRLGQQKVGKLGTGKISPQQDGKGKARGAGVRKGHPKKVVGKWGVIEEIRKFKKPKLNPRR